MADDKNFRELVKEMQDLNKSITKQNEGRESQLTDLTSAQNKTTEMVTRRLTKAQTAQLEKDNEQIEVDKKAAAAAEKSAEIAKKDSRMKMLSTRVSDKLKKAPSAIKDAAKFATYNNRIMRGIGSTLGKLRKGLGIGKMFKAGKDTLFGTIKKLIQGGFAIGGILLLDKFFNSDKWPAFLKVMEERVIPGFKKFVNFFIQIGKNIFEALDKDKTGMKFFEVVSSFFLAIGSLFGVGMDEIDKETNTMPTYGQNVKSKFKKLGSNLFDLLESAVRAIAAGFGYKTEEDDFFNAVKDDMLKTFKTIIQGFGIAFADANPMAGRVLGLKGSKEVAFDTIAKERPELSAKIMRATKDRGEGYMKRVFEQMSGDDREYTEKLVAALDEFEKFKPAGDKNSTNNALVAAILGEKDMSIGQKAAAAAERNFNIGRNLFNFSGRPDEFNLNKINETIEQSSNKIVDDIKKYVDKETLEGLGYLDKDGNLVGDFLNNKTIEKMVMDGLVKLQAKNEESYMEAKANFAKIQRDAAGDSDGGKLNIIDSSIKNHMYNSSYNSTNAVVRDISMGAFSGGTPF
jgi:hypothetical protein